MYVCIYIYTYNFMVVYAINVTLWKWESFLKGYMGMYTYIRVYIYGYIWMCIFHKYMYCHPGVDRM